MGKLQNVTEDLGDLNDTADAFGYLDSLRESGVTNMYDAAPYLMRDMGLKRDRARTLLSMWMSTFSKDAPMTRARAAIQAKSSAGES